MKPPHLTHALHLQHQIPIADAAGGHVEDWQSLGLLWAEVLAGSGRDPLGEERIISAVNWRISLRAAPEGSPMRPRPGQRLRQGARIFTILAVAERDPIGRYLTCFCREEAPR